MAGKEYTDYYQIHENDHIHEAAMEEIASTLLFTASNELMELIDNNTAITMAANNSGGVVEPNNSEISVEPALSLDQVEESTSSNGDNLTIIDEIIDAHNNEIGDNAVFVSSYPVEKEPYSDIIAGNSIHERNVQSSSKGKTVSKMRPVPVEFVDLTEDEPAERTLQRTSINREVKNVRLNMLLDILPDADTDFLKQKADTIVSDIELNLFVSNALEHKNYPAKYPRKETERIHSTLISYDKIADGISTSTLHDAHMIDAASVNAHFSAPSNLPYTVTSSVPIVSAIPKAYDLSSQPEAVSYTVGQPLYSAPEDNNVVNLTNTTKPHTVTSSGSWQSVTSHSTFLTVGIGRDSKIPFATEPRAKIYVPTSHDRTSAPVMNNVTGFEFGDVAHPDSTTPTHESLGELPGVQINVQPPLLTPPIITPPITTFQPVEVPQVHNNTNQNGVARIRGNNFPNLIDIPHNLQQNISIYEGLKNEILLGNPFDLMLQEVHNMQHIEGLRVEPLNNIRERVADVRRIIRNVQHNARRREHRNEAVDALRRNARLRERRNQVEDARQRLLMDGLLDMATLQNDNGGSDGTGPPKSAEEERYVLLCDILYAADRAVLRDTARNLKSDDDVDKYLIHAFSSERTWKNGIAIQGLQLDKSLQSPTPKRSDYKYKVLLELLPDASPIFLKRESLKLITDEDLHKFAVKLSREQSYPKRKTSAATKDKRKSREYIEDQSQESVDTNFQTLQEMLPDADPDFLFEQCKVLNSSFDIEAFVLKSVEENNYPKRDEFLKRQEFRKQWNKYIGNFTMKEFLQLFPNPIRYFYIEKVNSKSPLDIPVKFLQHRYCRKHSNTFGVIYEKTKRNLTKTCDRLDIYYPGQKRKYAVWDKETILPTSVLQEIAFIQNKTEIAHYLMFHDMTKLEAIEKAKQTGMLQECGCCYEEKLPDDIATCQDGHIFCVSCIKRGSEVVVGSGGCTFPCYFDGCKEEFSLDVVKTVLNPEVFSRMLTRKQYEEVNAAGICGLETCSFCEFCSIPPPEDKLFHCLNPLCMKVTCRSCKRLDHLPLTCDEFIEKNTRLKMQSYVEGKMTEALVRTCWQCGTKFVKESGCNMMQCKCGAKMCYFCRQPINDYSHFDNNRCGQNLDTTVHDEATVLKVGKQAKEEVEAANPGIRMENDPTELLKKKRLKRR